MMTETPPPTDEQRASEIRRLLAELLDACNAAATAGLYVEIEIRQVQMVRGLFGPMLRAHEGSVSIRREVL